MLFSLLALVYFIVSLVHWGVLFILSPICYFHSLRIVKLCVDEFCLYKMFSFPYETNKVLQTIYWLCLLCLLFSPIISVQHLSYR